MSDAPATIDDIRFPARPNARVWSAGARSPFANWRRWKVNAALASADAASALCTLAILEAPFVFGGALTPRMTMTSLLALAALLVCLHRLLGIYESCRTSPVELFRLRVFAAIVMAIFVGATVDARLVLPIQLLEGAVLVVVLVVVGSVGAMMARGFLVKLGLWQAPVVLVGEPDETSRLAAALEADPHLGMRVVGRTDPRLGPSSRAFTTEPAEIAIVIASGDRLADLKLAGVLDFPSVIIVSALGEMQTLWLHTRTVGDAVGIEIRHFLIARNLIFKRAFDLALATLLAIPAIPIVLALALVIWGIDRRNPFYAQPRAGRAGRTLRVWKLRSMYADAEARLEEHLRTDASARAQWQRCFKLDDDPRILPGIGRFIRRSSLDELPQLWNILRGEMSLVGPRPFPAYHLDSFDEEFRQLRASVVPGLTGLWQITSRSNGDLAVQKSADTFYVRNWSVWLDLYILLHTLPAVVIARGAR